MITTRSFGKTDAGIETTLYTIRNSKGTEMSVCDYGGLWVRAVVAGRDVLLGYNSVSGYIPTSGYLGALIGRVGNRIGKARFTLHGKEYTLCQNDGRNHLHGGKVGYNERMWTVASAENDTVVLTLDSPDGEEGYPGRVQVKVTYSLDENDAFTIRYEADTDKDTPVNLTNHAYFNLNGEGSITNHTLTLDCSRFTVVDGECIPTGELRDVTGTPFDFRQGRLIAQDIDADDEQIRNGKGYDHNFVIDGEGFRRCARLEGGTLAMEVYTDMPGVQFYAGNMLESVNAGKKGERYHKREGMCLETQFHPDSVNQPAFPCSILRAGEHYDHKTTFRFGA